MIYAAVLFAVLAGGVSVLHAAPPKKPVMGVFVNNPDEIKALELARALKDGGLAAAGYDTLILGDGWQSSRRDADLKQQFDRGIFPGGSDIIGDLASERYGLKCGLVTSISDLTLAGKPGLMGFEKLDARTFQSWGVSYLRVDYVHVGDLPTDKNPDVFPTITPDISAIGIHRLDDLINPETRYQAREAVFEGVTLKVADVATTTATAFLTGFGGPSNTATFNVSANGAGAYMLSVDYNKTYSVRERSAQAVVNGTEIYNIEFPRTMAWGGLSHEVSRAAALITLKDGSNTILLHNPVTDRATDAESRYKLVADALSGNVFFAINAVAATPEVWARGIADSSRVLANEINDFSSAVAAYETAFTHMPVQSAERHLDLGVINLGFKAEELKSQFTLWSVLNSPLILSGTPEQMADKSRIGVIKNAALIAISQGNSRFQARRTPYGNNIDVIMKPLENGKAALIVFNKGDAAAGNVSLNIGKLLSQDEHMAMSGFSASGRIMVTDMFSGAVTSARNGALAIRNIPASGVAAYTIEQSSDRKR
jgi:hypothetical protein